MNRSLPLLALVLFVSGCDCAGAPVGTHCTSNGDCHGTQMCIDGTCATPTDGGPHADGAMDAPLRVDTGAVCDSGVVCAGTCCRGAERCAHDACVPTTPPCTTNDDCTGDTYCDTDMQCTPYGVPADHTSDPDCERPIVIGDFAPSEQCHWDASGDTDAFATWNEVYSAPMVADFDLDGDRTVLAPSIVFASFHDTMMGGVLRVVDGRTCSEQATLGDPADRLVYATNFAIGDLDLAADHRPEIVAASLASTATAGGLVAFGVDPTTHAFHRLWYGRRCDMPGEPRHMPNDWSNNNGPSMHDLDDDGIPEVLFDRFVYDANGCLLNPSQTYANYLRLGLFAVAADVDADGLPELVSYDGVYAWSTTAHDWVRESYWAPPTADATEAIRIGHVAVADLGDFPGAVGDAPGRPEIVVAYAPSSTSASTENGFVRVMTIAGDIVFGPFPLVPDASGNAGRGGPPTIGDFDGDGRREFAVAAGSHYNVFDLDCDIAAATGPGCTRVSGTPRGVLWARPSQDVSSNVTGSSVFDFDADGVAEVVYGDECFLRIYRGTDGEVIFSEAASSGTGYELPVVADVDGDFNTEIVVAMTPNASCPATDPIFTRGTSPSAVGTGIRVLRDVMDRWAASRPIWNQHPYHVSHVADDGTIPATHAWTPNFTIAGLNNFRMNAQGSLARTGAADLTVSVAHGMDLCDATGTVTLGARVCNRGTNPVPDGARVVFYAGDPATAPTVCETTLPRLLNPTECTDVSCMGSFPAGAMSRDAVVVVDPDHAVFECRDGNNRGSVPTSACLM